MNTITKAVTKEQLIRAIHQQEYFNINQIDNILSTFDDLTKKINSKNQNLRVEINDYEFESVGDYHHENIYKGQSYYLKDFQFYLPFLEALILSIANNEDVTNEYVDDALEYVQHELDKTESATFDDLHEIINDSFDDLKNSLYEEVHCLEDVLYTLEIINESIC